MKTLLLMLTLAGGLFGSGLFRSGLFKSPLFNRPAEGTVDPTPPTTDGSRRVIIRRN